MAADPCGKGGKLRLDALRHHQAPFSLPSTFTLSLFHSFLSTSCPWEVRFFSIKENWMVCLHPAIEMPCYSKAPLILLLWNRNQRPKHSCCIEALVRQCWGAMKLLTESSLLASWPRTGLASYLHFRHSWPCTQNVKVYPSSLYMPNLPPWSPLWSRTTFFIIFLESNLEEPSSLSCRFAFAVVFTLGLSDHL